MTRHTSLSSRLSWLAHVGLAGVLAVGALGATACDKKQEQEAERAAEKAGEAAEKAAEKVGDAAEKAGEKIGAAAEKLGDKIGPASRRPSAVMQPPKAPQWRPPPGPKGSRRPRACSAPAQ